MATTTPVRSARMPVAFAPHGGGPWPFVDLGLDHDDAAHLTTFLQQLRDVPPEPPAAILLISAHWEEPVPTVMSGASPALFYDYYGFPPAAYQLSWPAPGSPDLAQRVRTHLEAAGFPSAADATRGFDHGAFVPLMLTYPNASVPVVQLSLLRNLDASLHLALGRALTPLRDEGVFIVGSGMTYHNMRGFGDPRATAVSETFDAWLRDATTAPAAERDRRLAAWTEAPGARAVHPREEHLLPLMVAAGAAGEDRGKVAYDGRLMGVRLSGYVFG